MTQTTQTKDIQDDFVRECTITKIIDGDTLHISCSLGFDIYRNIKVRLARINCPEKNTQEGQETILYMQQFVDKKGYIQSLKYDKYGRGLCELYIDGANISDLLINEGYAKEWDGRGPKPV